MVSGKDGRGELLLALPLGLVALILCPRILKFPFVTSLRGAQFDVESGSLLLRFAEQLAKKSRMVGCLTRFDSGFVAIIARGFDERWSVMDLPPIPLIALLLV